MLKSTTLKLSRNLLGISLSGSLVAVLLLVIFNSIFDSVWGKIAYTAINLVCLWLLIYRECWHEGFRDPNRVQYGHMKKFIYKGMVAGLITSIPYALSYLLYLIADLTGWNFKIFNVIFLFLFLPYRIIINLIGVPGGYVLLLLPLPLMAELGYFFGYRRISLTRMIVYKNGDHNYN